MTATVRFALRPLARTVFSFALSLGLTTFLTAFICYHTQGTYQDLLAQSSGQNPVLRDKPELAPFYTEWLSQLSRGDLGTSLHWEQPAWPLLRGAALQTIAIALLAALQVIAIAVGVGFFFLGTQWANARTFIHFTIGGIATLPSMVWLLLLLTFGGEAYLESELLQAGPSKLLLASMLITMASFAGFAHLWCTAIRRFQTQPYAITALAQGVSPARLYLRHACTYAWKDCAPGLRQLGLAFATGSVLLEVALGISGLGQVAWDSWRYRDVPMVMASGVFFCVVYFTLDRGRN